MLAITVDVAFDENDNSITDGDISLRDAIVIAPANETINFAPTLNGATIALDAAFGEIAFAKSLTIDASMLPDGITIDAGALGDPTPTIKDGFGIRIFNITGGAVTLKNLTLTGGDVYSDNGGAIRAMGDVSLTLDSVTIRDSSTLFGRGGGLFFQTSPTDHLTSPAPEPRLVINDAVFQNNVAEDGGGALIDLGAHSFSFHPQALGQRAEITRSSFLGNTAQDRGGGIATWQGAGAEVKIVESTISGNVAGTLRTHGIPAGELRDAGGGVYSYLFSGDDPIGGGDPSDLDNGIAKLVISGSTVDSNIAGTYGGGIAICAKRQDPDLTVRSQAAIVNSTISGNIVLRNGTEPYGGGALGKGGGVALAIYPNDVEEGLDAHFENVTITKNRGLDGGGIWSMVPTRADGLMRTWLTNTIASDNTQIDVTIYNNLSGSFDVAATRFNLVGAGNTIVDYLTHAPSALSAAPADGNILIIPDNQIGLAPLGDYGGPTRTHRLLVGSPAIDAGSNALAIIPFTSTQLTTDQRGTGFARVVDIPGVPGSAAGFDDIGSYEINPPKIIDVTISSTVANPYGTNPPYSFADIVGDERQLQTVPVGGANQVAIKFSESATVAQGDFGVIALNRVVAEPPISGFIAPTSANGDTATWTFDAALPGAIYVLRLADTITGIAGALDGEWLNPSHFDLVQYTQTGPAQTTSRFPSGNGSAGGHFQFVFTILPGDANRSMIVNIGDYLILQNNYNQSGKTWQQGDFTGEGDANIGDFLLMQNHYNFDWRQLVLLADYDGNWAIDAADEAAFTSFYSAGDLRADVNGDGSVTLADYDAFHALLGFGIDLEVVV